MSKENPGWFRRNARRATSFEPDTEAQRKRAPLMLAVFLAALVLVGGGVWALRVFVVDPAQSNSAPQPASSSAAPQPKPQASNGSASSACSLDESETDITKTPPTAQQWVVERWAVVPQVTGAGPCAQHDGFKAGFAHTQSGALLATYHYTALLVPGSPDSSTRKIAEYALVDGALKDSILKRIDDVQNGVEVRTSDDQMAGFQLDGYRIVSFTPDHADVELLITRVGDSASVAGLAKLVWSDGDWRIDPAGPKDWAAPTMNPRAADYVRWNAQTAKG